MGCTSSSANNTTVSKSDNPAANPNQPSPPMAFAIMRNSHEAIRASIKEMQKKLDDGDSEGFVETWKLYNRALAIHAAMEEHDMFPMLGTVSETFSEEKLPDEHEKDHVFNATVQKEIEESGKPSAESFAEWKAYHLEHLLHEEKVMMPLTMKLGKDGKERAAAVHEKLVVPAVARGKDEFLFYIGWIIKLLSQYGSEKNPANVAVRVFAHGLQSASTPEQWADFMPVIKESCSPEIWDEMVRDYKIDGPGMISAQ